MTAMGAVAPCGLGLANRLAHGLFALAIQPRLTILIFHRVLRQPDPLFPGEMDAQRFDALMAMLKHAFHVLTVGQAADRLSAGNLPARALCITFDDGYADNAEVALPILKRHGLKATFFIASGFLDGGRMWNDTVIESVRGTARQELDLGFLGLERLPVSSLEQRRAAIEQVLPRVKYLSLAARKEAIQQLLEAAGPQSLPDNLMMRSEQVQELNAADMEIGAHTVNHPILAELDAQQARQEIDLGRQHLASLIGKPIKVLAYPNGVPARDYLPEHVAMVREMGFKAAVSTAAGVSAPGASLFELPRFTPWDRSLPRWSVRLWLNLRRTHFLATSDAAQ